MCVKYAIKSPIMYSRVYMKEVLARTCDLTIEMYAMCEIWVF